MENKNYDENWAKKKLKKILDDAGVFHWPNAANGMGVSGLSDRTGIKDGVLLCIEAKRPGRRGEANRGASALQVKFLDAIAKNGGVAMVFDGEDDDVAYLKLVLSALNDYRYTTNLDVTYWKKK